MSDSYSLQTSCASELLNTHHNLVKCCKQGDNRFGTMIRYTNVYSYLYTRLQDAGITPRDEINKTRTLQSSEYRNWAKDYLKYYVDAKKSKELDMTTN